jgi:dynein heavy chain
MKHVSRVSRIVSNSSGHALLVGVGGSGRQSLSRLSAFISSCNTFMIVISSAYGLNDLKTDLQTMYLKAGVKDEGVLFLFTDGQITNEKFLVYINDLLSSGEVADLYAAEDKDGIRNNVRGGCKSAGYSDTPENLWNFFIGRIRKNLHMSICFSPVGDDMRNRAKKFPALITCTVIDWFQPWPFDALQSVAMKFLQPMEIFGDEDSPLRTGCVAFFPYSFEATEKVSQKFMKQEKRFSYSTPKSFLELLKQYTGMLGGKVDALEDKKERLTNGLEKLRVTQEQVAELEIVLTEKAEVVKVKVAEAEIKAEEVGTEKAKVSMETEKANMVAAEAEDISKKVNIQKASCEKDLAAALPLVAQAEAALDVLNVKDFQELKSLAKPPAGVDKLLESVMHLFCGIDPAVEVDKKGRLKDNSWKAAGKIMANPGVFLQNLKSYKGEIDDMKVTQQSVDGARGVKDSMGDDFTEDVFRKKSSAAAGLVVWVINIIMYYDVVVQVEPKRMALKEATDTLNSAQEKLTNAKQLVAELEKKLAGLMSEYDKVMKDKEATVAEAKKCSDKLDMAKRLLNALGANGIIWEQTVSTVADDLTFIPGDSIVACAFSSYVGIFTRDYREEALDSYMSFLRKNNVPLGPKPDPLSILCTEAEQAAWGTQGLPNDRVSLENGAIMANSQRWSLIIDPQLQGIVWIKNKDMDNGLIITRMGHSKMVSTFEQAIDQGKPVLIEALAESVDAVLQPVITRSTLKRGTKRMIKLGDKEINYSPNFRLMLQTKLSNPHYPPEIQAECTCINFTVTENGLEDQMLFLVVRLERPDLAKEKSRLIQQQNEFKVKLAELEALLLEKLSNAEGDILEDTDLILSLEDAKKTSDEVKEKVIIATETEAKINETSENYRPSANRGALVFFLMMDLRKIHSFYKYSLDAFLVVVTRAIESITLRKPKELKEEVVEEVQAEEEEEDEDDDEDGGDGEEEDAEEKEAEPEEEEEEIIELTGKDLKNRVDLLAGTITYFCWNYIARGLFSSHKLIVASMLAFRILVRNKTLVNDEVQTLYICPPDPAPPAMPENCKSWILDVQWAMLKTLESIPAFKSTAGALTQNLEQDSLGWKRWFSEERAESADLPRSFRDLSPFHRLMLLRVLRPDRIGAALVQFVQDNLGNQYVEMDPFSIEVAYAESTNLSPLFFVLFPGTDPTATVEWMAKQLGMTDANGKFVNISMGQGQEQIALNGLRNQAQNGGWIMLQNIHLMQSWLPQLDRALEVIEEFSHADFRSVLSSEPPSAPGVPLDEVMLIEIIPEATLQRCIKIADEAPADLKSNLRRAYGKFGPSHIEACQKQKEFKACLFSLCFFHSLIVGRRRFGPQGYSKSYPFNDGDLSICGAVLCNYLNAYENVPWPDLRYIFGEIMYGGHITDPWDRRITNTYLKVLITPELFNNMNLCPGFKSPDATKFEYSHYVKYTEEKFPVETPQMFWLHPNAEIGFLTNQGLNVFSTIMKISGGGGGGGGGDISAAQEHITNFLGLLPNNIDMFEIRARITEYTPYIIVSLQEAERMNVLLSGIRSSLLELELGIAGALNISDPMEVLSAKLQTNAVDPNWAKKAYPSLKVLATWFADLVLRVDQLMAWTAQLSLLKSLWLSGFFNPMSFLTAVMQVNARTNNLPLDFMVNRCTFTNFYEISELSGQPAIGVYGHGLFMEGAGWEDGKGDEEGYITDSKLKDLHPQMPICNVFAVHVDEMSWESMYRCPVYVTAERGPTFIFSGNIRMDADDSDTRWILAGAALLMTDD